ncbi:FRG domain-containing protein [Methylococcus mesophilus]|uniref:FRG domain-containing protein n=1 Tax=Methylococcus mesophilus TaxID=2993564 RepID=UPI00224AB6BC|nr:FRG domain-containing protein [Methylococcus mesophilus]UZR28017.1 FRG domain-containing protein [Methylococcus mesophilus]
MINIDEVDDHYEGVAYMQPELPDIPGTAVYLRTESKGTEHSATAYTFPIDPRTGDRTSWDEIKELYPPGTSYSTKAEVNLNLSGETLTIDGVSDIGVTLRAVLERPPESAESKIEGQRMSWPDFKLYVATISKNGYLFRGQQKPWRLRTSFHRRGRYRISEFIAKDVKQLHQRLSAITSHFFDLTVPDQNGAFFNLLQHHGYPTPLLDWSHSPYVAAFFAFRDRPIGYRGEELVRIYMFNNREWQKRYRQVQTLDPPFPHLSVMEFIAIGNPRLVPQQAVTTVTNLHDIEAYILEKEAEADISLLEAVDIPANERELAMTDLRFMGITAGSMFPSIDGVCEEMRERNFDR